MADVDYRMCDVCGSRAFYDANVSDPRYQAAWDEDSDVAPIGIAVICAECNKTHKCVVIERLES